MIEGKVISIRARIECGGCGYEFETELDPASDESVFEAAIDSVRFRTTSSIQGGYILCEICTKACDNGVKEDRNANREEVRRILKIEG